MDVEIDEEVLQQIAQMTGGEYFRATDKDKLSQIYDRINQLEKSKVEVTEVTSYDERFLWFVLAAIIALVAEFLVGSLWLRRIP